MRVRSTWSDPTPKVAAEDKTPEKSQEGSAKTASVEKKADIYNMNQEHPQPGPTDYESGGPDEWAESWHPDKHGDVEYEGGHVKRNEVGFPEFRADTWKHKDSDVWGGKGKYDNQKQAAERKAHACEQVARAILRTSNEKLIEDQALELMGMPNKLLANTLNRLHEISPAALDHDKRIKRATACAHLAVRTLGSAANEEQVEKLGSLYMSLDDPTLKSILAVVATVPITESDQNQKTATDTAKEEEESKKEAYTSKNKESNPDDAESGLSADEQKQLSDLLSQAQQIVSPEGAPAGQESELAALFEGGEEEGAKEEGAKEEGAKEEGKKKESSEALKASEIAISFDNDDEPEIRTAADDELNLLFDDDEEIKAQREIEAARREQQIAELGNFRTASSKKGAKRVGNVRPASSSSVDEQLEALWDSP
jgi:hypothetical protein